MFRLWFTSIVLIFAATNAPAQENPFDSAAENYPNWSPFTAVRWDGSSPHVKVVGLPSWYQVQTLNGLPVDAILAHCKTNGWDPKRRFTQDPVQVIRTMGHEIDKETSLQLKNIDGKIIKLAKLRMTIDARNRCVHPFNSDRPDYPNVSPFRAIKWESEKPFVQVFESDEWSELVAIHDVELDTIAKSCKENGWDFKKRISEDVVQLLRLMGQDIHSTTSLKLRRKSGQTFKIVLLKMTTENLDRIKKNRVERSEKR